MIGSAEDFECPINYESFIRLAAAGFFPCLEQESDFYKESSLALSFHVNCKRSIVIERLVFFPCLGGGGGGGGYIYVVRTLLSAIRKMHCLK